MKEEKTIIPVDRNRRILVYREFRGKSWNWYVEKQIRILWFFWGASEWDNGSSIFTKINYCTTKESAIREAETIKRNFLTPLPTN